MPPPGAPVRANAGEASVKIGTTDTIAAAIRLEPTRMGPSAVDVRSAIRHPMRVKSQGAFALALVFLRSARA
jgi:hypothetical protein